MPRRKTPRAIAQGLSLRLNDRLSALGWTIADLVSRLKTAGADVHYSTVGAWFQKGVVPDAWLLLVTCRVMKIDIEWALTGEGSSAPRKRQDTSEAERNARLQQLSETEKFLQGERARILSAADAAGRALGDAAGEVRAKVAEQVIPPLPRPARPARGSTGSR